LIYDGRWRIDFDSLASAITERTRAVVIVNPNNPTGSFLKREELQRLTALCAKNRIAILSDEVFSDYFFAEDEERVDSLSQIDSVLAFCLGGLSKMAGMPQMKLGWIVLAGPRADRDAARERLELIADTYLSVSTLVQHAVPTLIEAGGSVRSQIQERVRANLGFLHSVVNANSPCNVLHAEGGWYAILQVPRTRSEEQWCIELLSNDNVLVQPGFFYDFESEAYLVLSLLTPLHTFREGVQRLFARVVVETGIQ
jgi:aspartate/methionine/tyrosine aminotransferase